MKTAHYQQTANDINEQVGELEPLVDRDEFLNAFKLRRKNYLVLLTPLLLKFSPSLIREIRLFPQSLLTRKP